MLRGRTGHHPAHGRGQRAPARRLRAQAVQDEAAAGARKREVACSDLANMVESVNQASALAAAPPAPTSTTPEVEAQARATQQPVQASRPVEPQRDAQYYTGMLTTSVRETNGASAGDMLKRSLQFAGGAAALLGALLFGFMASNGLL